MLAKHLLGHAIFLLACGLLIESTAFADLSADENLELGAKNPASFSWIRDNILNKRCLDCHSAKQGDGDGLDDANFDSYAGVLKVVKPFHPELSKLFKAVASKKMPKGMDPMPGMPNPKPPTPLSPLELKAISDWILSGAPEN